MIPDIKLGWMAGVIDLKGRFLRKHNKQRATPQIILSVESKEIAVIQELGVLTGLKADAKKPQPVRDFMRRGCSEHCPHAHTHVGEVPVENLYLPAIARWTVTGAGMVVIVSNLLPYLIIDRDYVRIMEEVMGNTPITGQGSGMVATSLRRLSLLGWTLPQQYEKVLE